MRHNVLVYLNYFYDENIKDHDLFWRTKVVFWNFLNTIYEIFVFSEIVVFLPEKHFGKKFGQNQNFSYVIRHEVKTFLSTNTKSISIISAVIPCPMLFFFFSVLLANDQGYPDRARRGFNEAQGSKKLFLMREQLRARFPVVEIFSATVQIFQLH